VLGILAGAPAVRLRGCTATSQRAGRAGWRARGGRPGWAVRWAAGHGVSRLAECNIGGGWAWTTPTGRPVRLDGVRRALAASSRPPGGGCAWNPALVTAYDGYYLTASSI